MRNGSKRDHRTVTSESIAFPIANVAGFKPNCVTRGGKLSTRFPLSVVCTNRNLV